VSVTKMDLCGRISKRFNKTASEMKPILEAFLDEILIVLSEDRKIEIRGFGSFRAKQRKKRMGRNPRTGETVLIPAYTAPSFKFSKDAQKNFDGKLTEKSEPTSPKEVEKEVQNHDYKQNTVKSAGNFNPV